METQRSLQRWCKGLALKIDKGESEANNCDSVVEYEAGREIPNFRREKSAREWVFFDQISIHTLVA